MSTCTSFERVRTYSSNLRVEWYVRNYVSCSRPVLTINKNSQQNKTNSPYCLRFQKAFPCDQTYKTKLAQFCNPGFTTKLVLSFWKDPNNKTLQQKLKIYANLCVRLHWREIALLILINMLVRIILSCQRRSQQLPLPSSPSWTRHLFVWLCFLIRQSGSSMLYWCNGGWWDVHCGWWNWLPLGWCHEYSRQ